MKLEDIKLPNAKIIDVTEVRDGDYTSPEGFYSDDLKPMTAVRLDLSTAPGSNIQVEVSLPEEWNGRLLGLGNGGPAGRLTGVVSTASIRSMAVVSCDLGTAPIPGEAGIDNREVWKDFGWRATHLMTVAAKELISMKYGRGPDYSYFFGQSTGGQQALSLAQRFPEDYDGILAGVPGHCRAPLHAYFLWNYQQSHRPDGSALFTPKQEKSWNETVLKYFESRENFPNAKGRFISEPRWTTADRAAVLKLAARKDNSLTSEHLKALEKMMDGPVNTRTGERIYNGIPPASIPFAPNGGLYMFNWFFGKDADMMKINFDQDIDRYLTEMGPYLNADDPDLTAFAGHGGKMLMFSGTADSMVPYHAALDYYEQVIEFFGSVKVVQKFFRFYLLPGRDHGGNYAPGVQYLKNDLNTLTRWREQGEVPQMDGVRIGENGFRIPLKPYPEGTFRGGVERIADRYLKVY